MLGTSTLELQYYLPHFIGKNRVGRKIVAFSCLYRQPVVELRFTCKFNLTSLVPKLIFFSIYIGPIQESQHPSYIFYHWDISGLHSPHWYVFCLWFGLNWSFPVTVTVSELIFLTLIFHLWQLSIYHLSTSNSPYFPIFVIW